MARKSDNFQLVLAGGGLGLWILFHTIWTILFEDWIKHQLERLVGHTVAEMMEKFGSVGFPALAAIAIVWFLYSYATAHAKAESADRKRASAEAAAIPSTPSASNPNTKWTRDVPLLDAIWRAHLGKWDARITYAYEDWESKKPFYLITDDIRQKAFDGILPIWARRRQRPASSLFEAVPSQFWGNHNIEAGYCINPQISDTWVYVTHPHIVGEVPNARTMIWEDFMTCKEAVDSLWPAKTG
jgi:hypothetical protein